MRTSKDLVAVAQRLYWREADARHIVDAWRASGESFAGFARRLDIDGRRIGRWARRLDRSSDVAVPFHPVRVLDGDAGRRGTVATIDIEVGPGYCVRVPAGFATDDLRRVLAVLEEPRPC